MIESNLNIDYNSVKVVYEKLKMTDSLIRHLPSITEGHMVNLLNLWLTTDEGMFYLEKKRWVLLLGIGRNDWSTLTISDHSVIVEWWEPRYDW